MLRFHFAFAGLLSILPFTVTLKNKNSLRKFHQYLKCKKTPEKQNLTDTIKEVVRLEEVQKIYMQDGVKSAYMADFGLKQYHRIQSARGLTLES